MQLGHPSLPTFWGDSKVPGAGVAPCPNIGANILELPEISQNHDCRGLYGSVWICCVSGYFVFRNQMKNGAKMRAVRKITPICP